MFVKHGTDKATHGYAEVYEKLLEPFCNRWMRCLEVGVFNGASLRAWREYLSNAEIIGIDIMVRNSRPLTGGCEVVKGDSRSDDFSALRRFDVIWDDGSHKPRDQAATLTNLWPLLGPGGRYFIEDVLPIDLLGDELPPWFAKQRNDFSMEAFLELANAIARTGGNLTRHDFRATSGKPDSVLLEIRKP